MHQRVCLAVVTMQRTRMMLLPIMLSVATSCGDNDYIVEGPHHQYVVSAIDAPATLTEAKDVSIDLDGDGRGDNSLGSIVAVLNTHGLDVRTSLRDGVRSGGILIGVDLQSVELSNNAELVGIQPYIGTAAVPPPCLSADPQSCGQHLHGDAVIRVQAPQPFSYATGPMTKGVVLAHADELPIKFALAEGVVVDLLLHDAVIRMSQMTSTEARGVFAGVVSKKDLQTVVLPQAVLQLRRVLARDCVAASGPTTCTCIADSAGATVAATFDDNKDCQLSDPEFYDDGLIKTLLAPDIFDSSIGEGVSFAVSTQLVSAQLAVTP